MSETIAGRERGWSGISDKAPETLETAREVDPALLRGRGGKPRRVWSGRKKEIARLMSIVSPDGGEGLFRLEEPHRNRENPPVV